MWFSRKMANKGWTYLKIWAEMYKIWEKGQVIEKVLILTEIFLFENWSNICFSQAVLKSGSYRRFVNVISQCRKYKVTFFQDIYWHVPSDSFIAQKIIGNLFHIVYRNRLKWNLLVLLFTVFFVVRIMVELFTGLIIISTIIACKPGQFVTLKYSWTSDQRKMAFEESNE